MVCNFVGRFFSKLGDFSVGNFSVGDFELGNFSYYQDKSYLNSSPY